MAEAKAERIVGEELKRRRWEEADLKRRSKTDPEKLEIGARLRRETTLTLKVVAARVHLGSGKSANSNLHRHMASQGSKPLRNVRRRASGRSRAWRPARTVG